MMPETTPAALVAGRKSAERLIDTLDQMTVYAPYSDWERRCWVLAHTLSRSILSPLSPVPDERQHFYRLRDDGWEQTRNLMAHARQACIDLWVAEHKDEAVAVAGVHDLLGGFARTLYGVDVEVIVG